MSREEREERWSEERAQARRRDAFASAALQGILASPEFVHSDEHITKASAVAVKYADALIAELDKS